MAEYLTLGLDIGSTASKCVVLKNGREIVGSAIIPAGVGTSGPVRARRAALESAGLDENTVLPTAATGYGRHTYSGADYTLSELSCHAIGAHACFPEAKTVIDIGGQDAKAIRLSPSGKLGDFLMNDKCAAGTGRFLDVMARALELEVTELAEKDAEATAPVPISSTCTVFAESEVISQQAKGVNLSDLVAGIHNSVAARAASLVKRLGLIEPVVMTGGVARNAGVVRALERELGVSIAVSPLAQLNGAYGAAIAAYERYEKEQNHGSD